MTAEARPFLVTIKTPAGVKGEQVVLARSTLDALEQVRDEVGPYCKLSIRPLAQIPQQARYTE